MAMQKSDIVCGILFPIVFVRLFLNEHLLLNLKALSFLRVTVAAVFPLLILCGAYRRRSLRLSACVVAFLIGSIVTAINGIFSASLIGFFLAGSKATHTQESRKKAMKLSISPRTWTQVLSNGGLVAVYALLQTAFTQPGEYPVAFKSSIPFLLHPTSITLSLVHLAVLGALSCATGDTLASELAPVYSTSSPVLLTQPWKKVPIGTNGGVTLFGILISAAGGLFIGLVDLISTVVFTVPYKSMDVASFFVYLVSQSPVLLIGTLAATVGSLLDSLLGSTLQFTGVDKESRLITEAPGPSVLAVAGYAVLDNHMVNLVSGLATSLLTVYLSYIFLL